MLDFVNKIITIVLVFIMLVLAPLVWVYVREEMKTDRVVLNEMVQFIDRTTDKGTITEQDIDDLYIGVNAAGGTYDVQVKRYIRMSTQDENGEARTLYLSVDLEGEMNSGDIVKVTIEEIGISTSKRLLWSILKLDSGESKLSLAGSVR